MGVYIMNPEELAVAQNATASTIPKLKIRNKRTGEVKDIDPLEAQNFGLAPQEALSRVQAQKELEKIASGAIEDGGTSEQQYKAKQAERAVSELENLFGRGDSNNIGTDKDLSLAKSAGFIDKTKAKVSTQAKKIFDPDFQEDRNKYQAQLDIATGILTQAFGSGTPQEAEAKRLIDSAPGPNSTDGEAKSWFSSVRNLLGVGESDKKKDDLAETETNVAQNTVSDEPNKGPLSNISLRDIALKAADVAPAAGGIVGGLVGGLGGGLGGTLAGGVGALPGAAAGSLLGTGAGTAGGEVIKQGIRDILDANELTPLQKVEEMGKETAKQTAFEALGLGAGKFVIQPVLKGGGFVIKSLAKNIDDIPLKGIRVNPSQLTKFATKHGDMADFMVNRGYLGEDALEVAAKDAKQFQDAFDAIAMNESIEIPIKELGDRIGKEISSLAGEGKKITPSVNKSVAKQIIDEWDSIVGQLEQQGRNTVTGKELTEFRRTIDELVPDSQWIDPGVKNANIRLRSILNDTVSEGIESRMIGPGEKGSMKQLGKELSGIYDFLQVAEKQSNLGRGSLVANLTRLLSAGGGAGIGATLGGPAGAVVGGAASLGAEGLLRDPEVLKIILKLAQSGKGVGKAVSPATRAVSRAIPGALGAASQAVGAAL